MLKKILLIAVPLFLLIGLLGFVVWAETPLPPTAIALNTLQAQPGLTVESTRGWTVFRPAQGAPSTGFIFYPGGRVDARAYAPLLAAIARQGYQVVLAPMPLNLAVFGVNEAQQIISAFPDVSRWAVGGHSLGGAMAAQFAAEHTQEVSGLVFWAAYPAADMSAYPHSVLSISASQDGLATPDKIAASRPNLPLDTTFVVIEGGVHAQFGSYGAQPGDGSPTLPAQAQWDQTVAATVQFLGNLTP